MYTLFGLDRFRACLKYEFVEFLEEANKVIINSCDRTPAAENPRCRHCWVQYRITSRGSNSAA
jgi:hypothetical protein